MVTFIVKGMSCGHCVQRITQAVKALDADASLTFNLAQGRVEIKSILPASDLQAAINALDYSAIPA